MPGVITKLVKPWSGRREANPRMQLGKLVRLAEFTVRCAAGNQDGMYRHPECLYRRELDLETLVCTRGRAFSLSPLESRPKCPRCGSRQVVVVFTVPTNAKRVPFAKSGD